MKKIIFLLAAMAVVVAAAIVACQDLAGNIPAAKKELPDSALIARGDYLVTSMLCDDCHSPKSMGPEGPVIIPELRLSGHTAGTVLPAFDSNEVKKGWVLFSPDFTAIAGPWGASFAGNITSDATGIGNWSYEQFKRAITQGKYKGLETGRPLLPPMPWPQFSSLHDDDIRAIYAFLKSTPPVKNIVPAPKKLSELK